MFESFTNFSPANTIFIFILLLTQHSFLLLTSDKSNENRKSFGWSRRIVSEEGNRNLKRKSITSYEQLIIL